MSAPKRALLVMHYGTPSSIDEVLPYYTHIRRGRPPEPEQLQDLVRRYEAIGGPSPLTEISRRQAEAIHAGLAKRGIETALYVGTKHTNPFIADTVKQMIQDGVEDAVGIVLAPHYSTFSVAQYKHYAYGALDSSAPELRLNMVERWGALPAFIDALSVRVKAQLTGWDLAETLVLFSAHSLPERAMAPDDPYVAELHETCELVAAQLGIPHWDFAFQSAGATADKWLGPDVLEKLDEVATKYRNVVCCTVGFVADHLEVLYDLGIEARDKCAELGLNFRRADVINDDPVVMEALAEECAKLL